jgi:hypothetical protein
MTDTPTTFKLPDLAKQTNGDQWVVIAADVQPRLVLEHDKPVERDHTIVMLRNRKNGDLKYWVTPGKFTVEQLGAEK